MTETPGHLVILNGTSSAGKTSIARELQRALAGDTLRTGIDHFVQTLPEDFVVFGDGDDPVDGMQFVTTSDGSRVTGMRLGPGAVRFKLSMYLAAQAMTRAGFNVIVDDVLVDERVARLVADALGTEAWFVGVRCPKDEAVRREIERGDRPRGLVETQFDLVHRHGRYDLEVDGHAVDPVENAAAIRRMLLEGGGPTALSSLA